VGRWGVAGRAGAGEEWNLQLRPKLRPVSLFGLSSAAKAGRGGGLVELGSFASVRLGGRGGGRDVAAAGCLPRGVGVPRIENETGRPGHANTPCPDAPSILPRKPAGGRQLDRLVPSGGSPLPPWAARRSRFLLGLGWPCARCARTTCGAIVARSALGTRQSAMVLTSHMTCLVIKTCGRVRSPRQQRIGFAARHARALRTSTSVAVGPWRCAPDGRR
jgi:hypothetical protein